MSLYPRCYPLPTTLSLCLFLFCFRGSLRKTMKFIALLSGGKDSILSILMAVRAGHELVAVANLHASQDDEDIDSFTFQTVGCGDAVPLIAQCLGKPLRRAEIRRGQSIEQRLEYASAPDPEDEVETLYRLLCNMKREFPEVSALCSGAILSHYQRLRVESLCHRLGWISLAPLWQRSAEEILQMITVSGMDARFVKVATVGLSPAVHLGKKFDAGIVSHLLKLQHSYQVHAAGEGGEYETLCLDCPLFATHMVRMDDVQIVPDTERPNDIGIARLNMSAVPKSAEETAATSELRACFMQTLFVGDRMKFLPRNEYLSEQMVWNAFQALLEQCETDPMPEVCIAATWASGSRFSRSFFGRIVTKSAPEALCLPVSLELGKKAADSDGTAAETESVVENADRLFSAIRRALEAHELEPFFIMIFCPSMMLFGAVNKVYEKYFEIVRPPGRAFVEDSSLDALRVYTVVVSRKDDAPVKLLGERRNLHVQSHSPWASASIGPYAQANAVKYSIENGNGQPAVLMDHIIVSGRIGMVPSTLNLAQWQDIFVGSSPDTASDDESQRVKNFVAEFFFMMANSVVGLEHFGHSATDMTHATFFVTLQDDLRLIRPCWAAYFQLCSLTVPPLCFEDVESWKRRYPEQVDAVVVISQVLLVSKMPKGAMVEVILERREESSDE